VFLFSILGEGIVGSFLLAFLLLRLIYVNQKNNKNKNKNN
jgi:hypothetical protein